MALTALKNRLRCFIQSMYAERIVNDQFFQLQSMKEAIRRDYVVRAVTSFCASCNRLFSALTDQIYQQEVDFLKVHVLASDRTICKSHRGVVTEHFYRMVSQRQVEAERNQIVQLVETYFADVDTSLSELSGHVDNSEVDFSVLASLARGIEDKSARIGAEHMRLACSDIIQACDQKNKNRFCETLPWLKNEFTHTRRKPILRWRTRLLNMRVHSHQTRVHVLFNSPSVGSDVFCL